MANIKLGELLNPKRLANVGGLLVKAVGAKAVDHGPELLAVAAIGGLVATVKLAVDETPKAQQMLAKRPVKVDEDGKPNETKVEALVADVKAVAPVYLPAAVAGVATAGCIVAGNRIQAKAIKNLKLDVAQFAAAYSLSEKAMDAYKKEVIDKLGEDAEEEIRKKARERLETEHLDNKDECPFDGGYIVNGRENGDTLFYDLETGFVFWSTEEKIRAAEGVIAKDTLGGPQTVCDLYSALSIRSDWWKGGERRGWTVDGQQINIRMSEATLEPDGNLPKRMIAYKTQALGR